MCYYDYLQNPNPLSFMIKPTTSPEIKDIISKIDTSEGTGSYNISQRLIKSVKTSISTPLPNLFNMSFIEGQCQVFRNYHW